MPETGDYTIAVRGDDGVRLWVDGKIVIDAWKPQDSVTDTGTVSLEQGKSYDIKLEYYDEGGNAVCQLGWRLPSQKVNIVKRSLWVPPGKWQDLWSGHTYSGPATVSIETPLWQMPLFARVGGLVLVGPDVQYTSEKPWGFDDR